MNTLQLSCTWSVIKRKLKERYDGLADEDLEYIEGHEDELIRRIQQSAGASREEIQEVLDAESDYCGN